MFDLSRFFTYCFSAHSWQFGRFLVNVQLSRFVVCLSRNDFLFVGKGCFFVFSETLAYLRLKHIQVYQQRKPKSITFLRLAK